MSTDPARGSSFDYEGNTMTAEDKLLTKHTLTAEPGAGLADVYEADANELMISVKLYVIPILVVLGFPGNLCSFLVMVIPAMRKTSISVYLAALAWADTAVLAGLLNIWWFEDIHGAYIPGLMSHCNTRQIVLGGSMTFAASLVVAVTAERFIAVWFPFRSKELLTPRRACLTVFFLALYSYGIYIPSIFGMNPGPECIAETAPWPVYARFGLYLIANLAYAFGPVVLLITLNLAIVAKLWLQRKHLSTLVKGAGSGTDALKKATVVTMAVSVTYIVSTLPYNLVVLVRGVVPGTRLLLASNNIVSSVAALLMLVNHVVNFYIYALVSASFRQQVVAGLLCKVCRRTSTKGRRSDDKVTVTRSTAIPESLPTAGTSPEEIVVDSK